MPTDLMLPEDIDRLLRWSPGQAVRMARAGKLPHLRLPDGSIRFDRSEVSNLIHRVPARVPPSTATPTSPARPPSA